MVLSSILFLCVCDRESTESGIIENAALSGLHVVAGEFGGAEGEGLEARSLEFHFSAAESLTTPPIEVLGVDFTIADTNRDLPRA